MSTTFRALRANIAFLIVVLAIMCLVEVINQSLGHKLNSWGLRPHVVPQGLLGIICAPFLHRSFDHLLINVIAIAILGGLACLSGRRSFWTLSVLIIFVSGLCVWAFGRYGLYIGSGAMVFGYFGFMLVRGPLRHHLIIFLLALITMTAYVCFLLGYLTPKLTPLWDYHLCALLVGIVYGYLNMR